MMEENGSSAAGGAAPPEQSGSVAGGEASFPDPSEVASERPKSSNKKMLWIGLIVLAVIALVIGLAVGIPNSKDKNGGGEPNPAEGQPSSPPVISPPGGFPPATPTPPTTPEDAEYLQNTVTAWSGSAPFNDPESPQSLALDWMTSEDTYGGNGLNSDSSELDIQQRYTMALLYYSTEGDFWSGRRRYLNGDDDHHQRKLDNDLNWLSDANVCEWNNGNLDEDDAGSHGILCDDTGVITAIKLHRYDLRGSLPYEMGYMEGLRILEAEGNSLVGTLPTEYGLLNSIEKIIIGKF